MITPTVTEIPRTMNAVSRDTFIFGAGASLSRSEAPAWPARVAPAQPHIALLAAQREAMAAHATTFARAA